MPDHTRRDMRTPITLKIKFKSSNLDQFIERYSVDVSRGGIFIRTKEPLAGRDAAEVRVPAAGCLAR